ncbi:MAG: helix-turn-helix domain-containing protein [Syntrophaceae bacterium]|nr:helix-turn-helix domain-containing protein [Syntrophaceae bacterium]
MSRKIYTNVNLIADRFTLLFDIYANGKHTLFADKCGIPRSTMQNYKDGRMPSSENLIRICETFNVNINWLLTGDGEMELKSKKNHEERKETDLEEKMKEFEARLAILEKLLSESKPNPGRRWYDGKIAVKK